MYAGLANDKNTATFTLLGTTSPDTMYTVLSINVTTTLNESEP